MKTQSDHTPAAVLRGRWNTLLRIRESCLEHDDLDTVHDLRVATRRFRSALQVFGPLCHDNRAPRVSSAIRRLTRGVGELRNVDEAELFFRQECATTADTSPLFGSLLDMLHTRRAEESAAVRRLLKRLDVAAIRNFVERFDHLPAAAGRKSSAAGKTLSLPGYLSETSISLFSKVDHLLACALSPDAVETRHRLRIAIKHWRYFLEIVAEISGQDYGRILENLKQYQSVLGSLNDLAVFGEFTDVHGLTADERVRFAAVVTARTELNFIGLADLVQHHPLRYHFLY